MRRCVIVIQLLLSPALGGLAKVLFFASFFFFSNFLVKVEEVPLTPEDLLRVSSLTSNRVTKEMLSKITMEEQAGGLTEMSEKAILVEGDQGRPCILKPGQQGGWKKLCAVYWLPGGCSTVKFTCVNFSSVITVQIIWITFQ